MQCFVKYSWQVNKLIKITKFIRKIKRSKQGEEEGKKKKDMEKGEDTSLLKIDFESRGWGSS